MSVMRPHPASLIAIWLAFLFLASVLHGPWLLGLGGIVLAGAFAFAADHLRPLLRRSRWLLLMLLVLFGWMTPGTPVPRLPGASVEGLQLGGEHFMRLLFALSSLAMILRLLRPVELVAGMRSLLAPVAWLGIDRDRLAVRVALTLEAVENAEVEPAPDGVLRLPRPTWGPVDVFLILLVPCVLLLTYLI